MKQSKFEKMKKVGMISYISRVPDGVEAEGILKGAADTGNRSGWDPYFDFTVEVRPEGGKPFEARFRRIVAAAMVPNFQIGRAFRVVYNPADLSDVSFLSCGSETGETVDFRDFPVRLRKMEDTEMEPAGQ